MNLLVLGAGHIGRTIAAMLADARGFELCMADGDAARLARCADAAHVRSARVDVNDASALAAALRGRDAVINALPFHLAATVAAAAKSAGVHYFDLTEDVEATRAVAALAAGAQTVFMPQCGLAPGLVGIVAHDLAQRFERLDELHMRVGALPRYPTNALKYNLTWSTDGLINEYCNPCEAIQHGARTRVPALEGLETFALDGVEYEAFNTSGGLGTLCATLEGRVRNLDYKSVRYPGHCCIMKLLLDDLRLRDRRDILREIFESAIPTTTQDVVLVFVSASGWRGRHGASEYVQESFTARVHGAPIAGAYHGAIQITTAAGVLAAVDLMREGCLPQHGFVRQEDVSLERFRANRFGQWCFSGAREAAYG